MTFVQAFGTIHQGKVPISRKYPALLSQSFRDVAPEQLAEAENLCRAGGSHCRICPVTAGCGCGGAVPPAQLQGALLGPFIVADPVTASLGSETPILSK